MSAHTLFLKGHFSEQYQKGIRPDVREPCSPLPEVATGSSMEVVTGFMAAQKSLLNDDPTCEELLEELRYDDQAYLGGYYTRRYVTKEEKPPR